MGPESPRCHQIERKWYSMLGVWTRLTPEMYEPQSHGEYDISTIFLIFNIWKTLQGVVVKQCNSKRKCPVLYRVSVE